MKIVEKLSSLLHNTVVTHVFCDQDNIGAPLYKLIWQNGTITQAFAQDYDFDTDEYLPAYEININ